MSFLGKEYVHERSENDEEFVNSLPNLSEEHKQKLLTLNPSVKVEQEGDEYTLIQTFAPGRTLESKFQNGVTFQESLRDRTATSTITIDGNVLTHVQNFEDQVIFTFTREFTDDDMVTTVTSDKWDGVCKKYFKAA